MSQTPEALIVGFLRARRAAMTRIANPGFMPSPTKPTRISEAPATTVELLADKRDGKELSSASIRGLIAGFMRDEVPDYQMAAFLMAVVQRGMGMRETVALTLAMRDSGRCLKLGRAGGPKLDKHSTGGVGDKVSLCLAPLVAACGVRVPMISGRGLGHTGGTLDKLAAVPDLRVDLPLQVFEGIVNDCGLGLIGQTDELAPADKRLYALRDVTATVDSIPLITASILSKKLAENLDGLVLDVKVGRGAFMKTPDRARALAHSIMRVGQLAGLPVRALLTRMDVPLGHAVGNALETAEAFQVLLGHGPDDLVECTYALGVEMLRAGKRATSARAARRMLDDARASGRAAGLMAEMIRAQGGDPRVVCEPDRLPRAPARVLLHATESGYVQDLDAMAVAQVALHLGAGRTRVEQSIDVSVGLVLLKKPGDAVRRGDVLAEIHAADSRAGLAARAPLMAAYALGRKRRAQPALVIERVRAPGFRGARV
jgi:pyrimidine-nucleoside phosphorylase